MSKHNTSCLPNEEIKQICFDHSSIRKGGLSPSIEHHLERGNIICLLIFHIMMKKYRLKRNYVEKILVKIIQFSRNFTHQNYITLENNCCKFGAKICIFVKVIAACCFHCFVTTWELELLICCTWIPCKLVIPSRFILMKKIIFWY